MLSLIRKSLPALCLLLAATGAHGQLPEEEKRRIGELTARFAEALQTPDERLLDAFFERWQQQELTIGAGEPLIDTLYRLATDTVTLKRLGIGKSSRGPGPATTSCHRRNTASFPIRCN